MSETEQNQIRDAIQQAIDEHEVILFMKGTPQAPACGFSARTVAALQALQAQFAAVDVLPDPRIRSELSAISQWPTIPQLFVKGELVGGCDIVMEMYESGELAQVLGVPDDGARRAGGCAGAARAGLHAAREPARLSAARSRPLACASDAELRRGRNRQHALPAAGTRGLPGHPPGEPLRRLAGGAARARARARQLRRLLRAPALRPGAAEHLAAVDRRLPRRLGAAASARTGCRLDPPRGRHLGHLRGRAAGPRRCSPSAGWASGCR